MKMKTVFVLALLLNAGCAKQQSFQSPSHVEGSPFFVHLQSGFSGERMRVVVDGDQVFEGKPITNPLLGFAHEFGGSTDQTNMTVIIEIPEKEIYSTHIVDLTKAQGLGISVVNGKIVIQQANSFGYD